MICVPRAPSGWPQFAQNWPGPASAPQRGQWGTSGIGVPAAAVEAPGVKVDTDGAAGGGPPGVEAAGTKRVAAAPFAKERTTGVPGAAGGGSAAGGGGSAFGFSAGGGGLEEPIGAPHDAQALAPGSL
jgi:hypothetical protein